MMPMKNSLPFYSLWILLVLASCSNEQPTKSEITQYPITLAEEIQPLIKEAIFISKPITVSLEKKPPPEPNGFLYIEEEYYPEPPPPEPEPEPIFFVPEETMEGKWQKIACLPKGQIRKQHLEFCFNYGDTLVKQERYEDALELYEAAKELSRYRVGEMYFNIAKIYALQGKGDYEIDAYLEKARYKGFKEYKRLLYDDAFEDYRKWNKFSPIDPSGYL